MKIATWNINSVRIRTDLIKRFVEDENPDYLCLQEIKCQDHQFPYAEIEDLGYNVSVYGQKSYNGVAILSKTRADEIHRGIETFEDESARYIEMLSVHDDHALRLASIYAPNGNPCPGDKFTYKLKWYDALKAHIKTLLSYEDITVLAGDYNIIPRAVDVYDPKGWWGDALYCDDILQCYRSIISIGYSDAFMLVDGREHHYSFWDYQGGAYAKNKGLRIDHFFLNAQAVDRIKTMYFYPQARSWEKPSDHVPAILILDDK